MGLLVCSECGNQVSEYAECCPKCGCPIDIIKQSKGKKEKCIYKGKAYDFNGVEELLSQDKPLEATRIVCERTGLKPLEASTIVRNIKRNNNIVPANYDVLMEQFRKEIEARAVHCPYCNSVNVTKLKYNAWNFGNQWHCNKCGSDF